MTIFIPIDLVSIKRNPRAGQTTSTVPGQGWCDRLTITTKGNDRESVLHRSSGPVSISADGQSLECKDWVELKSDREIQREPFAEQGIHVSHTFSREGQTLHHGPIPEWMFQHAIIEVTCPKCGKTMLNIELEDSYETDEDGCQCPIGDLCKFCGTEIELEYETIEAALKRKGITPPFSAATPKA